MIFFSFLFTSLSGAVVMSYAEPGCNYSSQQLITPRPTHQKKYSLMGCPSARLFALTLQTVVSSVISAVQ